MTKNIRATAHKTTAFNVARLAGRRTGRLIWDLAHGSKRGLFRLMTHVGRTLIVWEERRRSRRSLAAMDDRLLRDIGVSRADAVAESDKPFWRR